MVHTAGGSPPARCALTRTAVVCVCLQDGSLSHVCVMATAGAVQLTLPRWGPASRPLLSGLGRSSQACVSPPEPGWAHASGPTPVNSRVQSRDVGVRQAERGCGSAACGSSLWADHGPPQASVASSANWGQEEHLPQG